MSEPVALCLGAMVSNGKAKEHSWKLIVGCWFQELMLLFVLETRTFDICLASVYYFRLCSCSINFVLGVPSPFFPGILLLRNPSKTQGTQPVLKRTMVEKNGTRNQPLDLFVASI